jgi:hypothetical protein
VLEEAEVAEELHLLGGIALVARLVPREHLFDYRHLFVAVGGDLVEHAQRPGDRVSREEVALDGRQRAAPLLAQRLEHPLLFLLVLDRLVVHHPETAHQAIEGLVGAVVGQRPRGPSSDPPTARTC